MEYVVGSVAALVSGNVTPSRPKHLKRALTPTKHQPSPNVTPKSELVDRSIFLSPTLQKKKAVAKKSPKRIFENQNLDVTEEESNLLSPKADKVKKHLEIELDANTSVNSSLLSPESPKDSSEMKKSPKKKVMNAAAHVYENTPPKNNKRKLNEEPVAKNVKTNDASPNKKKKQERKPLSQDASNVKVQPKPAQSPKKNNKPQKQEDSPAKQNNNKKNQKPQNQVQNSQGKQKQNQKPAPQNKANKPQNQPKNTQANQKSVQPKNKPAEKVQPQSPNKQNKKKNRKNKKNQLKSANQVPKPEPKVEEPESGESDDETDDVDPNVTNDSDDEVESGSEEDSGDEVDDDEDDDEEEEEEDDDDDDDDEEENENDIVNPNAITNKDSDSEHDSDDEIESENDEANKEALKPEESSDDEEEEEKDTKKKAKAKPEKKDVKNLTEEQKSEALEEEIKRTVFVGNVPFSKKCKKEIKKIFSDYGTIETIRIRTVPVKDASVTPKLAVIKNELHPERSTVNVYVKFADEASVEKALKANNTVLNGNHLRVHRTGSTGQVHDPKLSVFVGNIPFALEDEGLRAMFEKCGAIESVRIIRDRKTHAGKGFGYVNFESKDGVELALAMSEEDLTIKNRILRVKRCTQKEKTHKDKLPKKFVSNFQSNNKVQVDEGKKNNGAYRRIEMKRKMEARADGPANKRANLNQPREKKQRKEFVGMTAEKKKKKKFDKGQKKKKVLGQILAKK